MDIFYAIVFIVLIFVLMSICGWCCKKREGTVYSSSPVVVPPYPVEPRHPTPHLSGPLPAGFTVNQPPYPTHTPVGMPAPVYYPPPIGPYPPTTTTTTPYPPTVPTYPVGSHLGSTPYPPTADSSLPPSYQEAVGQTGPPPPQREVYSKQAPYNPNY